MSNKIKIYYDSSNPEVNLPKKAHEGDAAYDVYATTPPLFTGLLHSGEEIKNEDISLKINGILFKRLDYIQYGTGLYMKPEAHMDFSLDLRPRSSISAYDLILANTPATIDKTYRGEILVRFKYIWQPQNLRYLLSNFTVNPDLSKIYKKGDRICQMLLNRTYNIDFVEDLNFFEDINEKTDRSDGGFGSSGE